MTQRSVADYQSAGDSISMTKVDGKSFTIVAVEDSNYDDTPGVKITVKDPIEVEGEKYAKLHTTRHAIVKFFDEKVRADLNNGARIGPVHTEKVKAKRPGVNDYWVLKDD